MVCSNVKLLEKHIVYCTFDNTLIPIVLCYYNKYWQDGGYTTQEVICTNLNDMSIINYSLVNSVEG